MTRDLRVAIERAIRMMVFACCVNSGGVSAEVGASYWRHCDEVTSVKVNSGSCWDQKPVCAHILWYYAGPWTYMAVGRRRLKVVSLLKNYAKNFQHEMMQVTTCIVHHIVYAVGT